MEMMQLGFRVWSTIALHVFTRLPTKAQQREGGTLKMTLTLVCSTLIIATSFFIVAMGQLGLTKFNLCTSNKP